MPGENVTIHCPIEMNPTKGPEPEPGACLHNKRVQSICDLTYVEDVRRYTLDVECFCLDCGMQFRFDELPVGITISKPSVSVFGSRVTLPITPAADMGKHERFEG